jgi:hypothetical protein
MSAFLRHQVIDFLVKLPKLRALRVSARHRKHKGISAAVFRFDGFVKTQK